MSKVLSQNEIDALLSSSSTPEEAAATLREPHKRVITYDFKHPNRISKDQIRTLENIHSSFAGKLSSAYSGMLRAVVDIELLSVDQITYSEFIAGLSSPSCIYTFSMKPLEGLCVADFNPALAFAFVDRMFGGRGRVLNAEREMTGIELNVMDKVARRVYRELSEAWARIAEFQITQEAVETTPQFIQIVPPGETVIVTTLQLTMLEVTGVITLCYPYLTLEPLMAKVSGQYWSDSTKTRGTDQDRQTIRDNLKSVETPVSATLAETTITMREFLAVNIGDVILTEAETLLPARVFVGGIEKFAARPGMRGRRRALEIIGPVDATGA
ncbi:MAG: flagellar motor switch protein FliM [Candidatus Zixiibacteriota bacterium]